MPHPFLSVIVLNYNGVHYLPGVLDAMRLQTYPADRFEVIITDNGSTDDSLPLLKRDYPWVRLLENGRNLGFSTANNKAVQIARGDFVILLNNDTAPEPMWLEKMVEAALSDPKIGIVTGHLRLFYDQLELDLQADTFTPPGEERKLGIKIYDVDTGTLRSVTQYLDGFYWRESDSSGQTWRWMQAAAHLGVPAPVGAGDWQVHFKLASGRPDQSPVRLRILLQGQQLAEWEIAAGEPAIYTLQLPASTRALARPLEQNTGSILFRNGGGRDRGTYVRNDEVFYEIDDGQYNRLEEVFAGCGASYLMRREMFTDVGLLDDDYFIYYEDTDLSWRARLRGWRIVYAPEALVRHIHCGTNKEWSPFFIFLTERNRLATVFKNGTTKQIARVWSGYYWRVARMGWDALIRIVLLRPSWRHYARPLKVHLRIAFTLLGWLPALIRKRARIQGGARVSPQELEAWFAE